MHHIKEIANAIEKDLPHIDKDLLQKLLDSIKQLPNELKEFEEFKRKLKAFSEQ